MLINIDINWLDVFCYNVVLSVVYLQKKSVEGGGDRYNHNEIN